MPPCLVEAQPTRIRGWRGEGASSASNRAVPRDHQGHDGPAHAASSDTQREARANGAPIGAAYAAWALQLISARASARLPHVHQVADHCENDPLGPVPDLPEEGVRSLGEIPAAARLDRGGGLHRRRLVAGVVQHADGVLVPAAVQVQRQLVDRPLQVCG